MQIGGLVQSGCHGSGANLPPLEQIVQSINIINANGEEIELTEDSEEFHNVKCGLGCFGAIVRMEIKCVEKYYLKEEIQVMDLEQVLEFTD